MIHSKSICAIVKPTHECNLACRYCYVEGCAEKGRMDSKTVETMLSKLLTMPDRERVTFIWHGGEPLLMGLDFYRHVGDVQRTLGKGKEIRNLIQTNCTLVTDAVLNFCEDNDFHIGSSMDGPREIHDLTRVYPNGAGSFDAVWRGVQMTRERNKLFRKRGKEGKQAGYLGGGVIVVLNRHNVDRLDEIYDFFRSHRIPIKVNPLIRSGRARLDYEDLSIGPAEYGQALVKLFDRWFTEPETSIDVDPLSDILGDLMTGVPTGCSSGKTCRDGFISIGPNGDIYPCGRFDGIAEYHLGNIREADITEVMNGGRNAVMARRGTRDVDPSCESCKYRSLCNSGCMHNGYTQAGNVLDKDFYCPSYKMLFRHLETALDMELSKAAVSDESEPTNLSLPILSA